MSKSYIDQVEEEFTNKFVEPMATEMRAMTLNGEPCVMGTAKDIKSFLRKSLAGQAEEMIKFLEVEDKKKWKDAVHCSCLNYCISKLKEKYV